MQHLDRLKPTAKPKAKSIMSNEPIVSHGRGGAGNIEPDGKIYTDGEIVREGPIGDQGDGAYSTGRGGVGNIDSPSLKPKTNSFAPGDADVIPEPALKKAQYDNYHVGRGGEGNVHKEKPTGHEHEGVLKKVEHIFGGGKKEGEKRGSVS